MDNKQHILNSYIKYRDEYIEKYGENTVVLMEVGSFFEIYAVINDEICVGEKNIYNICQNLLGIAVTRRNKKILEVSYNNYLQAGVPSFGIKKYTDLLLNNNYTVVIVGQITSPPNPERGVTEILSPGTCIDNYNKNDSNYLMSVYIEKYEHKIKDTISVGISIIDLSTGLNYINEIKSQEDANYWSDEISRFINFYNPVEILIQTENYELTKDNVINKWDIYHDSIQINHYDSHDYKKINYQNEILLKVFDMKSIVSPIEYLDLENKNECRLSYIYMLQYIYEHKVDILRHIEIPVEIKDINYLSLTSNSIRQLNVVNNYSYFKGKNESLLSICNNCSTSMGRRLLKERLLYPSIKSDIIQNRYDQIKLFQIDNFYDKISDKLSKIYDLEKLLRRMGLGLLTPNEFFTCNISYEYIEKLIPVIIENKKIYNNYEEYHTDIIIFNEFLKEINDTFLFSNFNCNTTPSHKERKIFKTGINDKLDECDNLIELNINNLDLICKRLSKVLDIENSVKYDYNDKNNWFIYCTKKRAKIIEEKLKKLKNNIHVKDKTNKNIYSFNYEDFTFKTKDTNSTIITCKEIEKISKKINNNLKELSSLNTKIWNEKTIYLYSKYKNTLKNINKFIANIDISSNNAKLSIENGYYCPILEDNDKSFVIAKDIRHPIVEKINEDTEYITNDISLGKDKDGILLFGTNACGKSTLMKAIGLNIIMAQAGLYVASKEFRYKPYQQIFTRILNNDNIFKAQSSFAVEIQELNGILQKADKNSLVLGDELCSGTETISAISIVATGIEYLCNINSSFIFTSHLHQLTKLEIINKLKNLYICHLKIDMKDNKLIYDRKLIDGSGPSIYGLIVCDAIGLSSDFISKAKKIQFELENESHTIIEQHKSQYNNNIYLDMCLVCKTNKAEETHHIKEQENADENNMIDHIHKNIKQNLAPLCKKCHKDVTYNNLVIKGFTKTSDGIELNYYYTHNNNNSNGKKYTTEQIDIIKKYYLQYKNLSQKNIISKLELDENIKISVTTYRKIINNNY
jgi:DNA mismatch repair protein MutS